MRRLVLHSLIRFLRAQELLAVEYIANGAAFTKGRDFAAWLGLVPKQMSTGDRTILGRISKRMLSRHAVYAGRPCDAAQTGKLGKA